MGTYCGINTITNSMDKLSERERALGEEARREVRESALRRFRLDESKPDSTLPQYALINIYPPPKTSSPDAVQLEMAKRLESQEHDHKMIGLQLRSVEVPSEGFPAEKTLAEGL